MAKKGGIVQAFRTLFKVVIFGLAGVLAFAIYLNWQRGEDIAAVAPEVALPEVTAPEVEPEAVEETVVEAVEEATTAVEETVTEAVAEASEAVEETITEVTEGVSEAVDGVTEAVEETVAEATDVATQAVEGAVGEASNALEASATTIIIPGSDDAFTLVNAFRRDTGAIEITTEQTAGGTGATLWLVTCAPLAVGTIATGDTAGALGPRTEDPEMTEIPLSDPRAMIAGTACGVMR